jgi:hypothetical protein|tara:strand:- start:2086 stop:2397 length:312 start_codon:yes stop_codon:yes gene_type:complete
MYSVELAGDFRNDAFIVTDQKGRQVYSGTKQQVEDWLDWKENQSEKKEEELKEENDALRKLLEDIRLSAFVCECAEGFTIGIQESLENHALLSPFNKPDYQID